MMPFWRPQPGVALIPTTRDRVPARTSRAANQRIRTDMETRLRHYERRPDEIPARLRELDAEWDTERAIELNASVLALLGALLGAKDRRWLVLPGLVSAFLLQHAIQGWCPPVPILRRLRFRTSYEIEEEREALKALRGDFDRLSGERRAASALAAARQ